MTAWQDAGSQGPPSPRTPLRVPATSQARTALLLVFLVLPVAFLENQVLGFQMSGWAWLFLLGILVPTILTEPLPGRAIRHLLPYLMFLFYAAVTLAWVELLGRGVATLAQLTVPAVGYLVAWRVPATVGLRRKLRTAALWGLGIAALLAVVHLMGQPLPLDPSIRGMSIGLIVLFVVATMDSRSAPRRCCSARPRWPYR